MASKSDRTHTVLENLNSLLLEEDLVDFRVKVEGLEIPCHRVILAASSHFFKALLRSNMKEEKEGCVTLSGMSATTFQIILKALYTGKVDLTIDDLIEIWYAADQLLIEFMVEECETFALKFVSLNPTLWMSSKKHKQEEYYDIVKMFLDNFQKIYKTAKSLRSNKVVDACQRFIVENFDCASQMVMIMELPFEEFLSLIKSQNLNVSSEDTVLETVMKWVKYVPEEKSIEDYNDVRIKSESLSITDSVGVASRKDAIENQDNRNVNNVELADFINIKKDLLSLPLERNCSLKNIWSVCVVKKQITEAKNNARKIFLTELIQSVRTCLVSARLLNFFLNDQLILDNTEARDIVFNAILYWLTPNRGQWHSSAIHRACSKYVHCGIVYVGRGKCNVITAYGEKLHRCVTDGELYSHVTFVVFDDNLYATGVRNFYQANSSLCVLKCNAWKKVAEIPGLQLILVPYDQCIFILDQTSTDILQIFPKDKNPKVKEFTKLPETINLQHAINYQRTILIFSSVTVNGEEKTAVHQLDILTKKLTELETLNGPAEQIISFSDDNNTYVLQTNGNLCKIAYTATNVTFHLIGCLWNIGRKLKGALTYKEKLIIFGQRPRSENAEQKRLDHLTGYFNKIKYWGHDLPCSNFVPVILPKSELIPI